MSGLVRGCRNSRPRWRLLKLIAYANMHAHKYPSVCMSTSYLHALSAYEHTDAHKFGLAIWPAPRSPSEPPVPVQRDTVWHLLCFLPCLCCHFAKFCALATRDTGLTLGACSSIYRRKSRGIVGRKIFLSAGDIDAATIPKREKLMSTICLSVWLYIHTLLFWLRLICNSNVLRTCLVMHHLRCIT